MELARSVTNDRNIPAADNVQTLIADRSTEMSIVKSSLAVMSMIAGLAAFAGQSASQEINPFVRDRIIVAQNPQTLSERRMVRIQVGINFFLPGPTNDGDEANKLRDRARRTVYEMAGRECGLLQDTIAAECRLESVTVNVSRQVGQMTPMGQVEGFQANGRLGFQITLKQ
jgi:hypothetical protein